LKKGITKLLTVIFILMFVFSLSGCEQTDKRFRGKVIKYEKLDNIDKKMLSQLNKILYKSKENLWKDYELKDKAFILIRKDPYDEKGNRNNKNISYYAVNVKGIEKLSAKKVSLPSGFFFDSVYRFKDVPSNIDGIRGNYSEIGEDIKVGDSENVFCFKYNVDNFKSGGEPSIAFSPFFTREAFHFYMQKNWKFEGDPISVGLTKKEISYIGLKYKVLDEIRKENEKENISIKRLNKLISEYIAIEEERKELHESYIIKEHSKETKEGAASYVALRASRLTDTRYGVLTFADNKEKVTFSMMFDGMSKDKYPTTFLGDLELYNTGMELCLTLNNLNIKNWQKRLNNQTLKKPLNIYDILYKYYEDNKIARSTIDEIKDKYNYDKILKKSERILRLL